jgi:hypothetical protein
MGFDPISSLAQGGVAGLGDAAKGVGEFLKDIRTAITGEAPIDANKRAELMTQSYQIEADLAKAQMAVNQAEASSNSLFKGGWRPFIGWVCGFGLFYEFLLRCLLPWTVSLFTTRQLPPMPDLDMGVLMNLVAGMLGLGALRTYEKVVGAAK